MPWSIALSPLFAWLLLAAKHAVDYRRMRQAMVPSPPDVVPRSWVLVGFRDWLFWPPLLAASLLAPLQLLLLAVWLDGVFGSSAPLAAVLTPSWLYGAFGAAYRTYRDCDGTAVTRREDFGLLAVFAPWPLGTLVASLYRDAHWLARPGSATLLMLLPLHALELLLAWLLVSVRCDALSRSRLLCAVQRGLWREEWDRHRPRNVAYLFDRFYSPRDWVRMRNAVVAVCS
jgi:hypothetical protein